MASPAGDLEAATAAVAEAVAALDHDRQELQNAQAKETENQQRQVSLTKQIQAGQAKYQELQAAVNEGRLNVNQTQTELVNKQGQLPAELPDLASAERWLKEEEQALADFASQQTQNQDALSRAQTQLTQLTTTSQQLADSAKATAAEVDQRKRELTAALAERQAAWEVFERALARVPELAARQREVNDYRQRLALPCSITAPLSWSNFTWAFFNCPAVFSTSGLGRPAICSTNRWRWSARLASRCR